MEELEHIFEAVCRYYGIEKELAYSKSRKSDVVKVRFVFSYIAYRLDLLMVKGFYHRQWELMDIANFLDKKSHATIISGLKSIKNRLQTDVSFYDEMIGLLRDELKREDMVRIFNDLIDLYRREEIDIFKLVKFH